MFSQKQQIALVLLVALVFRVGVLIIVHNSTAIDQNGLHSRAIHSDAWDYLITGQNIAERGKFSLQTSEPFEPDFTRTPGYPLLIAVAYVLSGGTHNITLIIAIQLLLSLVTVWLVIRIGRSLFSHAVGVIAGLLIAVAPATLVFVGGIGNETLLALCIMVLLELSIRLFRASGPHMWGYAFAIGLLAAFAAYVRPIALIYIVFLLVAIVALKSPRRKAVLVSGTILAVFLIGVLPWYFRNYMLSGVSTFSSISGGNLLIYNVGAVEARRQGISLREARDQLWVEFDRRMADLNYETYNNAEAAIIQQQIAFEHILEHPVQSALFQSTAALNSLRPGYSTIMLLLHLPGHDLVSFRYRMWQGDMSALQDLALFEGAVVLLVTLYYGCLYGLTLIGGVLLIKRRRWDAILLFGLTAFWFLYAPGDAGNSRFRVPVEGIFALVAAVGAVWLWQVAPRVLRRLRS
ncbi:ArnT family glycosyltransferase [Chloroflexota bacterium]